MIRFTRARIVSRLASSSGDRIRITSLFEHPTIRALARTVERGLPTAIPAPAVAAAWPDHSIAVIGMACRFPGADTVDQFWSNLRSGRESVTFFGPDGLDVAGTVVSKAGLVRARGVLSDVDCFDARLFRLTPAQAQMLDPQQRVWLECVHRAMEDAGLPVGAPEAREGANIGVFAGGRESSYLWHLVGGDRRGVEALLTGSADDALELQNSNDRDSIATRTSYLLGFTGPSINVQTACSTSLVAVAQACQALVSRHCDVAVAGGVAVTFPQRRGHRHQAGGLYSRDGHCRPFDADASGTVFSDGAGVVVLKRLEQARADGDRIDAVIRGWAVNNDGANKASFTAPSVQGQARVIAQAQDHAGVRPHEISYVEAHGTGTPVGDPIEFAAFDRAFRRDTEARGFCALGSVKSNIGHADTAAGIAGLIKTILALKHGELPATLHYRRPNPEIDVAASPFYVIDRLTGLDDRRQQPHRRGVVTRGRRHQLPRHRRRSAGAGRGRRRPVAGVPRAAVRSVAGSARRPGGGLPGVRVQPLVPRPGAHCGHGAATPRASCGANGHPLRQPGTAPRRPVRRSPAGTRPLPVRLSALRHVVGSVASRPSKEPPIGFVFAGQGSQHVGMGRALFEVSPEFRRLLQSCERLLRSHLDRPLLDVMFDDADAGVSILRTEFAQPALFALEYLAGRAPAHVGCHAPVRDRPQPWRGTWRLAWPACSRWKRASYWRPHAARLMQGLPGRGGMRAVAAGSDAIEPLLRRFAPEVSIAAINSPTQTVLSGDLAALEQLGADLRSRRVSVPARCRSHTRSIRRRWTRPCNPLAELFARIPLTPPRLRLISNRTGRRSRTRSPIPVYWSAHAREPVLFAAGIETLIQEGCETLVEIGPDGLLSRSIVDHRSSRRVDTIATLQRGEHDWDAMLETLARLYVRGARVDWRAFQAGRTARPVRLPTYPFQRARHWLPGPPCRCRDRCLAVHGRRAPPPARGSDYACPGPRRFASKRASASCRPSSSPTIDCSASRSRRGPPISRCWPRPRQSSPGATRSRSRRFASRPSTCCAPCCFPTASSATCS